MEEKYKNHGYINVYKNKQFETIYRDILLCSTRCINMEYEYKINN